MKEIWKDIPGYNGRYLASNKGRIKSIDWLVTGKRKPYIRKGKILKQSLTGKGYKSGNGYLACRINGKLKKVHRLVALVFVENPRKLPQVNHKDMNTTNNLPENLEWCTNFQNSHHSKQNRDNRSSKYIGVHYRKDRGYYDVCLKHNKIRYRKGGFKTESLANEYLTALKQRLCL